MGSNARIPDLETFRGYLYTRSIGKKRIPNLRSSAAETSTAKASSPPLVWFSTEACYGSPESYGAVITTFHTTPKGGLNLLPLHTMKQRKRISRALEHVPHVDATLKKKLDRFLLDPDEQYSGGAANATFHRLLLKALTVKSCTECRSAPIHGTIIEDARADEECAGPNEVVLWGSGLRRVKRL